jgi:methanogenic corrinoid protein MtbC1
MTKLEALAESLVELEEPRALQLVHELVKEGERPQAILDSLAEGMNQVGEKYGCEQYFLADLVFAADIFRQAMEVLEPAIAREGVGQRQSLGKIVIGTVEGDLHDIGKNIFVALARNAGFVVHDLGINVPPARFVEKVRSESAQILGMSGILTMSVAPMARTVELLEEAGLRDKVKVVIGGLPVDDRWQQAVGCDAYTDDAYEGLKLCKAFTEVA